MARPILTGHLKKDKRIFERLLGQFLRSIFETPALLIVACIVEFVGLPDRIPSVVNLPFFFLFELRIVFNHRFIGLDCLATVTRLVALMAAISLCHCTNDLRRGRREYSRAKR